MPVVGFIAGLGLPELLVILVLVLILFGAGRLPHVFESFGKGIRALRDAASEEDETNEQISTRSRDSG
ncbi:MAG: twin-arginine translocase TatA/TatE family subunit [Myxococcota bacterium]